MVKVAIFAKSVDLAHGYRRTRQPEGEPIHDAGDLHQIERCTIHLVGEYWKNPQWEGVWAMIESRKFATMVDTCCS